MPLAVSAIALLAFAAAGMPKPASAQDAGSELVVITDSLDAPDTSTASAAALVKNSSSSVPVKKVVNGQFGVEVDNGWVVYQGFQNDATLSFYNTTANGNFNASSSIKLGTGNVGGPVSNGGPFVQAGGIVFTQVPAGTGQSGPSEGGVNGIGIGFGQLTFGPGSSIGGWTSDVNAKAQPSDAALVPGSTADLAIDPVNGAYEVGWDTAVNPAANQAFVIKLDAAGNTFLPTTRTDLGTLGGSTSQALGISQGATYVVGTANDGANVPRATYALVGATTWTDLATSFPTTIPVALGGQAIKKSKALVATDNGWIAGNVMVHRNVAGRTNTQVEVGFVVNVVAGGSPVFFGVPTSPDASVVPLRVLPNGNVIGNLEFVVPKGAPAGTAEVIHPFLFNGTNVVDYGVMFLTLPTGPVPAFGCRANRPNHLGQIAGSCIQTSTDTYGAGGFAFFLDTTAATPAFTDLNARIHARDDASVPQLVPYTLGTASSIDDELEITLVGVKIVAGVANRASFLASQNAYH